MTNAGNQMTAADVRRVVNAVLGPWAISDPGSMRATAAALRAAGWDNAGWPEKIKDAADWLDTMAKHLRNGTGDVAAAPPEPELLDPKSTLEYHEETLRLMRAKYGDEFNDMETR